MPRHGPGSFGNDEVVKRRTARAHLVEMSAIGLRQLRHRSTTIGWPRWIAAVVVAAAAVSGGIALATRDGGPAHVSVPADSSTTVRAPSPDTSSADGPATSNSLVVDRRFAVPGRAMAEGGDELYVFQPGSGSVSPAIVAIDATTGTVRRRISAPPNVVAMRTAFASVWLVLTGPTRPGDAMAGVERLDADDLSVQARLPIETNGRLIAVGAHAVWIATNAGVSGIDPASNRVLHEVALPGLVSGLDAAGDRVVVGGVNNDGTRSIQWDIDATTGRVADQVDLGEAEGVIDIAAIDGSKSFASLWSVRGSARTQRHLSIVDGTTKDVTAVGNHARPDPGGAGVWLAEEDAASPVIQFVTGEGVRSHVALDGTVRDIDADASGLFVVTDVETAHVGRGSGQQP
jgi:hypothetical protein